MENLSDVTAAAEYDPGAGAPALVADIGGTNSRLAIAGANRVDTRSIRRFKNHDFGGIDAVIKAYLAEMSLARVSECCIAVAGPVTAQNASLTNLDWRFDSAALRALTASKRVVLINDLVALGYGADRLARGSRTQICPQTTRQYFNGQSLIVGLGTGLNVAIMRHIGAHNPVCFAAELGHSSLPQSVTALLAQRFDSGATYFATAEDCFSGRGLSKMFALISGRSAVSGVEIVSAWHRGDPQAKAAVEVFSTLTGAFCRDLVFHYMPLNGIYFAGSVARAIFGNGDNRAFDSTFHAPSVFGDQVANIPVCVINDDAAALTGCAAALSVGR